MSYVCYLSYFSDFYEKGRRNIHIAVLFLFSYTFCFVVSSELVSSKKCLCFFQNWFLSNISFWILKLFILVEEKPSEVRTI